MLLHTKTPVTGRAVIAVFTSSTKTNKSILAREGIRSIRSICLSPFQNTPPIFSSQNKLQVSSFTNKHIYISAPRVLRRHYATDLPPVTKIEFPALSPSMTSGSLVSWKKKIGDKVSPGDVMGEIETDKATMEFECQEEGYLAIIFTPAGTKDVPVRTLIALLVEEPGDIAKVAGIAPESISSTGATPTASIPSVPAAQAPPIPSSAPSPSKPPAPAPATPPPSPSPSLVPTSGERVFASPFARATAAKMGIDISLVPKSTEAPRITFGDVSKFAAAPPATPTLSTSAAPSSQVSVSELRKLNALRVAESKKTIPHYYLTMEFPIKRLLQVQNELNEISDGQYKVSVNHFVIKAAAQALIDVPAANSSWFGDFIRQYNNVDINLSFNTSEGTVSPLLTKASRRIIDIASEVSKISEKVNNNTLTQEDVQVGTFSITDLSAFGVKHFSPVITPPQGCVLGVGALSKRLSIKKSENAEVKFEEEPYLTVTLSCDHRVVDGAVGAQWLQAFRSYMENPLRLI